MGPRGLLCSKLPWFNFCLCSRGGSGFFCVFWNVGELSLHSVYGVNILCELWLSPAWSFWGATLQPFHANEGAEVLWLWSGSQKDFPHGALFHLSFGKCYEFWGWRELQEWKHCKPSSCFPHSLNNLTSLCAISWCTQEHFKPHPHGMPASLEQMKPGLLWEPLSYPLHFCAAWKAAWRQG